MGRLVKRTFTGGKESRTVHFRSQMWRVIWRIRAFEQTNFSFSKRGLRRWRRQVLKELKLNLVLENWTSSFVRTGPAHLRTVRSPRTHDTLRSTVQGSWQSACGTQKGNHVSGVFCAGGRGEFQKNWTCPSAHASIMPDNHLYEPIHGHRAM